MTHSKDARMDRLKYLIYECFENSVFVAMDETETIEKAIDKIGILKMNNHLPRVPSNQSMAKDK